MRYLILTLFAFVYLTTFALAQKGGGGGGGGDGGDGGDGTSGGRTGAGGGSPDTNATDESSATALYAHPNAQTYLNLQNILIGASVLALAQHHLGGN
ncbi:hypothetical protein BJV82DRAFT_613929 [Fennellomyces sp. T-0311]|nr:hypothetical protein BJV82DRAFT_613929 [Fennellomyces sp. T-0311]